MLEENIYFQKEKGKRNLCGKRKARFIQKKESLTSVRREKFGSNRKRKA